jgi:hypothetical protein
MVKRASLRDGDGDGWADQLRLVWLFLRLHGGEYVAAGGVEYVGL